jgi:hypothetical protein
MSSVRSSIWNVLDHFFHDEWIAHHKPYDLRRLGSSFKTQNVAQVEFREEHKAHAAKAALYNTLQIREGIYRPRRLEQFDHFRLPDRRPERGHSVEWYELVRLKRSTSTFAIVILSSITTFMDQVRPTAS